jgi:hypothetical protein
MNTILHDQNTEYFIRLVKAQRIAYNKAKKYLFVDAVSILIAIIPTILIIFFNNAESFQNTSLSLGNETVLNKDTQQTGLNLAIYLSIFSFIWTIISLFSDSWRVKDTKIGATIQEQFDTELFKISWNEILISDKIEENKIVALSKKNKKDENNWYLKEVGDNLNHNIAVLLHYKTNTIWGAGLRESYSKLILYLVVGYYFILFCLSVYKQIPLPNFIILVAPSLPFLVYSVTNIKSHQDTLLKYREISKAINKHIDYFILTKKEPDNFILRQIQDLFFIQRLNPYQVPNWFYKWNKKHTNGIAEEAIKMITQKIN